MSTIPQAYAESFGIPQPAGFNITDLGKFISGLISIALIIAGILTFTFLVWGGIEWLTSGGDKGRTENARNRITAALVGLAIIAASYAIMLLIQNVLGLSGIGGEATLPTLY